MTKDELKAYLVDEAEYTEEQVDRMDDYDMLDAYLSWNGIIGYTSDIIDTIKALNIKNL